MTERWIPLGVRLGVQEPASLKDGFFDDEGTLYAISQWVRAALEYGVRPPLAPLIGSCKIPVYRDYHGSTSEDVARVKRYASSGEIPLLNTVEYLAAKTRDYQGGLVLELNSICLHYNVNWQFDSDSRKLVHRVLPATQEHYLSLAKNVDQVCSEYLQQAFMNAYGHNGDPSEAWVASRKAVEFLLHPIVAPKDNRATISKMRGVIQAAPHKWVSSIPANDSEESVLKFVELLKMMPYEPGHHGQTPGNPTVKQARAQFSLALAICQILVDGGFRLADS